MKLSLNLSPNKIAPLIHPEISIINDPSLILLGSNSLIFVFLSVFSKVSKHRPMTKNTIILLSLVSEVFIISV